MWNRKNHKCTKLKGKIIINATLIWFEGTGKTIPLNSILEFSIISDFKRGWSGGAKVLGKLPVLGRPTNLDYRRARAYCTCSRYGWGCLDIFSLIYHFSFLSPSLWETARYRLKYCLKGPLSPKQPTNQPDFKMRTVIIWHWFIKNLVGTWRRNDVDATSLRRIDVITTSCACWEFAPPPLPPPPPPQYSKPSCASVF